MDRKQKELLLISSSRCVGYKYLEFALDDIKSVLEKHEAYEVLCIPFAASAGALPDIQKTLRCEFHNLGFDFRSILEFPGAKQELEAINSAKAFYVNGGNTFRLLKALYYKNLIEPIRKRVLEDGVPYIGVSAGANVATVNICTTNDMPIEFPPSFNALGLVPFNINPHFPGNEEGFLHLIDRRERIMDYLEIAEPRSVVGLPEGSYLHIMGDEIILKGVYHAVVFIPGRNGEVYSVGSNLGFLAQEDKICNMDGKLVTGTGGSAEI